MTDKRPVCVIPARGGSKRLPDKNIAPFFGHPLLAYSVAAARHAALFSRILVSTDDPRIGRIAQHYGAEYLERPAELASDTAGLVEVCVHALEHARRQGLEPDAYCQLMPNCPLRRASDVVALHELFTRERRSFQISVVPYRGVYPHWALRQRPDGTGEWIFGERLVPSQQLGKAVCPTGAVWWASVSEFLEQRTHYGRPWHVAEIDADRGIDIDTREELVLADLLVRGLRDRDGTLPLESIAEAPFAG